MLYIFALSIFSIFQFFYPNYNIPYVFNSNKTSQKNVSFKYIHYTVYINIKRKFSNIKII